MRNLKILAFSIFFISALALIGFSLKPAVIARLSATVVSPETASLASRWIGQSLAPEHAGAKRR